MVLTVIPKFDCVPTHWPCHMSCPTLHVSTIHASSAERNILAPSNESPQKDPRPMSKGTALCRRAGVACPRRATAQGAAHHQRIGGARNRRAPAPAGPARRRLGEHHPGLGEQPPSACSPSVSRAVR